MAYPVMRVNVCHFAYEYLNFLLLLCCIYTNRNDTVYNRMNSFHHVPVLDVVDFQRKIHNSPEQYVNN